GDGGDVQSPVAARPGRDGAPAYARHGDGRRFDYAHADLHTEDRHVQAQVDEVVAIGDHQAGLQQIGDLDVCLQGSLRVGCHADVQQAALAERFDGNVQRSHIEHHVHDVGQQDRKSVV